MRITRQLLLSGAMLLVGIAAATTGTISAEAGRCTLWNPSITDVAAGECYYTNDTVGPIAVNSIAGTVNGGSGADSAYLVRDGGVFNGGGGDDQVGFVIENGTFNGGAGDDSVNGYLADSGTFNGGKGDDYMQTLLDAGTFNGGPGEDTVNTMTGGTFSGGPGADTVTNYIDGTVWSADY